MNILHYSLGFPPFRTGGMTKYCMDIMKSQIKQGHKVILLWPGKASKDRNIIYLKKRKEYFDKSFNIKIGSYELKNAMPVPLLDGIKEVDAFTSVRNNSKVVEWIKSHQIDVIHIHTLMGLPTEFLDAAKLCGIKLVFTSHDYFGLCTKCSFMNGMRVCNDIGECNECPKCNETALSLNKIRFMQSSIYKLIKEMKIIKSLRKHHIKSVNMTYQSSAYISNIKKYSDEDVKKYRNLREYYIKMLSKMDSIHFNSKNTLNIYTKYFDASSNGTVIPISHSSINNHKKKKEFSDIVRFSYLGPISVRKGFFELKKVLDNLYYKDMKNFELNIYSHIDENIPYIVPHESYSYDELEKVMDNTDVLIVPSIWNETFGFTVLEALSYGVPVIVSDMVGSKDLLCERKSGLIYNNLEELEEALKEILLTPQSILSKMNEYILNNVDIKDINEHTEEIINLYKKN